MLRAIIFDHDGVIADTEPLHFHAFSEVLASQAVDLPESEYYARYMGLNDRAFLRQVFADQGHALDGISLDRLQRAKDELYQAKIAGGIELLPGVSGFVRRVSRRWPLAICSGARRREIQTVLGHADLLSFFPVIVSADDVDASKPDPAGYVKTLELLRAMVADLAAGECLVVEDSPLGITAAKAAGMRVLAVRAARGGARLSDADATVPDLRAASDDELLAMFD